MYDVQGVEKVKNTCAKTVHAGTIATGFTVLSQLYTKKNKLGRM
jgi:hypothetical protein